MFVINFSFETIIISMELYEIQDLIDLLVINYLVRNTWTFSPASLVFFWSVFIRFVMASVSNP